MHNSKLRLSAHVCCAAVAAVLALAAPGTSHAASNDVIGMGNMTKGYTYYNLPGSTAAEHTDTVTACAAEAFKVRSADAELRDGPSYIYSHDYSAAGQVGEIVGNAIGNAIVDQMIEGFGRGVYAAAVENCMVVRGWRVVRLPQTEGLSLSLLPPGELAARLAPWTGAEQPHGEIVRIWKNDALAASTRYLNFRPTHNNDGLLSLAAVTGKSLAMVIMPPPQRTKVVQLDSKWPQKAFTPDQFATTPAEGGVIVVRLTGTSKFDGLRLILVRMGTDPNVMPSTEDRAPDVLIFGEKLGSRKRVKDNIFTAFAAPPGRWRIAAITGMADIGFCMGAPSFPIAAGEVVYAGTFNMAAADLGPDLSLEAPKAWLAGKPAADTIRPAAYTNGSQSACGYNGIYALEFNGVPSDANHRWGSAANASRQMVTEPEREAAPAPTLKATAPAPDVSAQ